MDRHTHFDGISYQAMSSKVECVQELGLLEDAKEQGRLIITTAGIGGKLYEPNEYGDIYEWDIISVAIGGCVGESYLCDRDDSTDVKDFDLGDIGRGIYLTRAEAETELRKANE